VQDESQYLIHEVAELAGVSTRTIRYYIAEGLLPTPASRGRYAYYDPVYIDLIRLIKKLKEAFLPLKEIRMLVQNITPERIQELLRSTAELRRMQIETGFTESAAEDDQDENTAAGYINQILRHDLTKRVMEQREPRYARASLNSPSPERLEKPAFLRKQQKMDEEPRNEMLIMNDSRISLGAENEAAPDPRVKWHPYEIMEGVELNLSDDVKQRAGGKLGDIIVAIKQMFKLI
jgi:DNA-binding transcriptional MerR regulator